MERRGLKYQLPSDPAAVEPLCLELAALFNRHGLSGRLFAVELVAREMLNNAILHGNRQSPNKQVGFCLTIGRRWIRMTISDQGPGYDWRQLQRALADPEATCGRGITIARLYAHKVRFGDQGRRIEVWFDKYSEE